MNRVWTPVVTILVKYISDGACDYFFMNAYVDMSAGSVIDLFMYMHVNMCVNICLNLNL